MEVDGRSPKFIWAPCHVMMCTAQLYPLAETQQLPPSPSYTRALLVSQDRRHLFITPCCAGNVLAWRAEFRVPRARATHRGDVGHVHAGAPHLLLTRCCAGNVLAWRAGCCVPRARATHRGDVGHVHAGAPLSRHVQQVRLAENAQERGQRKESL